MFCVLGVVTLCIQTDAPKGYVGRVYWGLRWPTGGLRGISMSGGLEFGLGLVGMLSRATRSVPLRMHADRRKARVLLMYG